MKSLWRKKEEERVLFHFSPLLQSGMPSFFSSPSPLFALFLLFLLGLLTGFPFGQTRRPLIWHKRKEEGTAVKVGKGSKWRKRKWSVSQFGDEGKTDLGSAEMRMIGLVSRRILKYLNYLCQPWMQQKVSSMPFQQLYWMGIQGLLLHAFSRPYIYFPPPQGNASVRKLSPLRLIFSRLEDNSA